MTASGSLVGFALHWAEGGWADLSFARPSLAWLAVLVVLAILAYLWGAQQRERALAALGQRLLIERLVASVAPAKRLARAILVVSALALLVVALMRPQYGGVAKVLPSSGLDIVLVVDYSKSMLAQDVYPSRSERLEAELARFIDESGRRGDRVGVVVFAGAARAFPLTSDMDVLRLFLERADPRTENPGGTAIGKALDKAVDLLVAVRREDAAARAGGEPSLLGFGGDGGDDEEQGRESEGETYSDADQVIVLLTDGEDTVGDPLKVAERAAQLGIRIYSVGIGSTSGEPVLRYDEKGEPDGYVTDEQGKPVMTRLDGETLESLASATKGEFVRVDPDRFGLDEVRERIAELSTAQREQAVILHRQEGFIAFVLPALVMLCVALGLDDRRRAGSPTTGSATALPTSHLGGREPKGGAG